MLFACLSTRLITYQPFGVGGDYEINIDFQLPWKGINIYYKVDGVQAKLLEKRYSNYEKGALGVNEFVAASKDHVVIKDKDGTEYSLDNWETKSFDLIVEGTSHKQIHYRVTFNIPEKDSVIYLIHYTYISSSS